MKKDLKSFFLCYDLPWKESEVKDSVEIINKILIQEDINLSANGVHAFDYTMIDIRFSL